MKRISKARRAFLVAVVQGRVCQDCRCAPADVERAEFLCWACYLKWIDADDAEVDRWP